MAGFTLSDGEIQLESTLHQEDLLDVKIDPFKDAPRDPISMCTNRNRDVMAKSLAVKLLLGKPLASDKDTDRSYYRLLAEASPTELIPIVHLRRHYKEALVRCLLDLTNGKSHETAEESNLMIFTASNFEAETSSGIVIVDLMTHWCGPCKGMISDLEKLAQYYKGRVKIGRVDVSRNWAISERFDNKEFPTLILLKNGEEASRRTEGFSYAELLKWTEGVLQTESSLPSVPKGEQSAPAD